MISKVKELDWATIDWDLFALQKEWLASCRNEHAEGILSLMDYIEDSHKPVDSKPVDLSYLEETSEEVDSVLGHYLWLSPTR